MAPPAAKALFASSRLPHVVISQTVWLYFRLLLSLRVIEHRLVAREIVLSHETMRQWALKFGRER